MLNSVLVISFYFPPYKRVGGRRWAKHAKYLNRLGLDTQVLTGEFLNSKSSWDDDIVEYQKNITRLTLKPVYKPYFESTLPKGFLDKIKWKLSQYRWSIEKNLLKENYKDASRPNKDAFLQKSKELIVKHNINAVILSVGPFAYSSTLVDLKAAFPKLKLVLDYRDPWEEAISGLNEKQKAAELSLQSKILKTVDLVLTVNDDISEKIRKLESEVKVITLPHCVDDDFLKLGEAIPSKQTGETVKMIYGGELYTGLKNEMELFVRFVNLFATKSGKKTEAEIYAPYPSYETILNQNKAISLNATLLKEDYQQKLSESDFILLFKSPLSSEAFFSSKFYEILCLRKPLLFFGKPGMVSDFILQHRLGFHITNENLETVCAEIITNMNSRQIPDRSYELYQHSFEFHTKKLLAELEKLTA